MSTTRFPAPTTQAPGHQTERLPAGLLSRREQRNAVAALPRLAPGRYLAVDDVSVSRRHALIVVREQGTVVLDDRSLNGVYVNGARVTSAILRHGDVIGLGRAVLRFIEIPELGHPAPAA
jgi:pSer/pThr/pTyr-binding forkhead associated (FHA) protein